MGVKLSHWSVFLLAICLITLAANPADADNLQSAISFCRAENVSLLLKKGADPNSKDIEGRPILRWLASGKCNDTTALATAKLLDQYGAKFENLQGIPGPSLLVNLASRHLPNTLGFIGQKKGAGDATEALRAIARKDDLDSIRALLAMGADPFAGVALSSALMDATESGQEASVREMLKHVADKQSPKAHAAYGFAVKSGKPKMVQAFLDAGMSPPKPAPIDPRSRCLRNDLSFAQTHLLERLVLPNTKGLAGLAGQMHCKFVQTCGDLILIDCNSAADGPAYYIDQKAEKLLATCGGACMKGCTNCPPKEWTCECVF